MERLAEFDKDIADYARNGKGLLVTTNNCQPAIKVSDKWLIVNSKKEIDQVVGPTQASGRDANGNQEHHEHRNFF